jgi:LytS/YehU family sensor histidine kinase
LNKQNSWKYVIGLILLYGVYYGIHVFTFDILSDLVFPGYYLIAFYDHVELFKYFVVYIGITTLFILSKSWFDLIESRQELAEKEKEMIQNELKALRAQINPHFLFNSLNSIYSLALNKKENAPQVILKLSDVLRYMIYESNEAEVDLKKELLFIENYIDLQKLRTKDAKEVCLKVEGTIDDQKVIPLIFIVFIENAFKHGMKGDTKNQYVHIKFTIENNKLEFTAENNVGCIDEVEDGSFKGLGLENVKRRLELLYKGGYHLDISQSKKSFVVKLNLTL